MADSTAPGTTLAEYVQAVTPADEQFATECEAQATALVAQLVGADNRWNVPAEVQARAVLEVGADLFNRRQARNGIVQFDGIESVGAVRISRNPLASAYPLLQPYIPLGL